MTGDELVNAAEVEAADERAGEEVERERVRRAVAARRAKRDAMKKLGADTGHSREGLHERLEGRVQKINAATTQAFRARKAATRALQAKRKGKS